MPEESLSARTLYSGRIFDLRRETIRDGRGKVLVRDYVVHPGAVAILPFLDENHVILVKQFRLPARATLWEIPAGTLEDGEEPDECARREMVEETGYLPQTLDRILSLYPAPGYTSEIIHLYTGRELVKGRSRPEVDEDIEIGIFRMKEVMEMIGSGRLVDGKSICAILAYHSRDILIPPGSRAASGSLGPTHDPSKIFNESNRKEKRRTRKGKLGGTVAQHG